MDTRRNSLNRFAIEIDKEEDVAKSYISPKNDGINVGLWFDKYIAGQDRKGEGADNSADKFKQRLLDEVAEINTPEIYTQFYTRWKDALAVIGAKFKIFKVEGRMVAGLGAESVLETSIALHRTYSVPFIAGSALKGLAASYAHKYLGSDWQKGTKTTQPGKAHHFVFGSQDSAGFITFHDALYIPNNGKKGQALWSDIMTVHHSEYYGGKNVAPADWDSPVPIPFLSATGNYLLAISSVAGEDWIKFVFMILEKALQEEGIGAKTSSGYGRGVFEKSDEDKAEEQERIRVDNFVKRVKAVKNVAGEINTFYQEWKNLSSPVHLRKDAAQAILDKVREAGRERQSKDKPWYMDLKKFVSDSS